MKPSSIFEHHIIGPLHTNSYILSENHKDVIIIDAGGKELLDLLKNHDNNNARFHLLLTHGHSDHTAFTAELKQAYKDKLTIYLHEHEKPYYMEFHQWGTFYFHNGSLPPTIDYWIQDEPTLEIGHYKIKVIQAPGHTPGSVIYYFINQEIAFVGDVIFNGTIGRTDFPHSDHQKMQETLKRLITVIPKNTIIYPGHDQAFPFHTQFTSNPFIIDHL